MARQRVVVRHSGRWERHEYIDGDDQLVHLPLGMLSCETLLDEIHEFMETSRTSVRYTMSYLLKEACGRTLKGLLKTDADLVGLIQEQDEPIVYATEKIIHETPGERVSHVDNEDPIGGANSFRDDVDEGSDTKEENYSRDLERVQTAELAEKIRESGCKDQYMAIFNDEVKKFGCENLSPKHSGPSVSTSHLEGLSGSHWSIPMVDVDNALQLVDGGPSEPFTGTLAVGSMFLDKDELSNAVKRWHLRLYIHAKYCVARSNKTRFEVVCKKKGMCSFRLYATVKVGCWRVKNFEHNHTFQLDLTHNAPPKKAKT